MVSEASSQPPHIEAVAHLILVLAYQFASQKGGDVGRFDRLNEGFQEMGIKRLQGVLAFENQVSGIFRLHNAPIVT